MKIALLVIAFVYIGYRHWTTPGTTGFGLVIVGGAGWAFAYAVQLLVAHPFVTVAAANVERAFVEIGAAGWFVLGYELYRQRHLPLKRVLALLWIVPAVQLALWTNPLHGLARAPGTHIDANGVLHTINGPFLWVHALYDYALILLGLGMLVSTLLRSRGLHRDQVGTLLAGGLLIVLVNAAHVVGATPVPAVDPTPLAFVPAGVIMSFGLFRLDLFELTPVARDRAMAEMAEATITIDANDRVADLNGAARELLATDDDAIGAPVADVLGDCPALADALRGTTDTDTEIEITHGTRRRHYLLNVTPISYEGGDVSGRLVVLRDVTELKEREAELALLKQVLARVLRHNVRNSLSVVISRAETLEERTTGEEADLAAGIVEQSRTLARRSEKARSIERIVDRDQRLVERDICRSLTGLVDSFKNEFLDADIELDVPPTCRVRADSGIDVALENLLENALLHGDSPTVTVTVERTAERALIRVVDDGPGIPDHELAVLDAESETPLEHGSGIGLWLVTWILDRSDGTVSFERTDGRTVATVELQRVPENDVDRAEPVGQ
ncbi:histidine kinase N-terminal 7TM domain-containing protein [Halorientalis marina]|uniref:histidine kinase N-terminal 7TM domain-containing protein n=1 Tax=Halorientalis marina TaxID=2931976 RepID=UPI0027E35434|nr:histidine kinase N-terminal 7TM domain-containing protein [Halorientalis marina]